VNIIKEQNIPKSSDSLFKIFYDSSKLNFEKLLIFIFYFSNEEIFFKNFTERNQ